jgi:XTP/dITP diphosphohydrolase
MRKLLIATNNPGKVIEIQELLQGLEVVLYTPEQSGITLEVEENGKTYAENALLKGRAFCQASGMLTLADDSGLEVDVLGGLPGLHSARFSPKPGATSSDRRFLLLQKLAGYPRPWKACFRCLIALISPNGQEHLAEGVCPGEIIPEERGQNGFGYDPIFLLPELNLTMAELPLLEKNKRSHRALAVMAALPQLMDLLKKNG